MKIHAYYHDQNSLNNNLFILYNIHDSKQQKWVAL